MPKSVPDAILADGACCSLGGGLSPAPAGAGAVGLHDTACCSLGGTWAPGAAVPAASLQDTSHASLTGAVASFTAKTPALLRDTAYCSLAGADTPPAVLAPARSRDEAHASMAGQCSLPSTLPVSLLRDAAHCSLAGVALACRAVRPAALRDTASVSAGGSVLALAKLAPAALRDVACGSVQGSVGSFRALPAATLGDSAFCSLAGDAATPCRRGVIVLADQAQASFQGKAYLPGTRVILAESAPACASFAGGLLYPLIAPPDFATGYPGWVPQPGVAQWDWLQRAMTFGSTVEGVAHLNLPNGSEIDPFTGDVQWGLKGHQYKQYNPAWLATLEDPPTPADPTYAVSLQRIINLIGLQEQLTAVPDAPALHDALVDEEGNTLWNLLCWDLDRPTGDDGGGEAAVRVGGFVAPAWTLPLVPQTLCLYWTTHGRGHGIAYQGKDRTWQPVRGDGLCTDNVDPNAQIVCYRQPTDSDGNPTGDWEPIGSCNSDLTGRFRTPPAAEQGLGRDTAHAAGWRYKVAAGSRETVLGKFASWEYALVGLALGTKGAEIYVVELSTNIIYVFEYQPNQGIDFIYTSPARQYDATGKAQSHYPLPKSVVADTDTDGSPAGYADARAKLYLYHLKDSGLQRVTSEDWGATWSETTTVIPATENLSKAVEANLEGVQYCFAVDGYGVFWCYRSHTHFEDSAWDDSNRFQITTGADVNGNPGWYHAHGVINAFCFVDGNRKNFESKDMGRTWGEVRLA